MTAPASARLTLLPNRGVIAISGEDRVPYLQGLVSNDVRLAAPDKAIYTWLMTPQGKYLFDFFIYETGDALLLDVEADRFDDLLRKLKMYKLRAKITLENASDRFVVAAIYGEGADAAAGFAAGAARGQAAALAGGGVIAVDPRTEKLGVRALAPRETAESWFNLPAADFADYDRLRLALGVPDGARDLIPEKSIALENNMDALGALSWDKGCYMGQELTARTKYRGLVKKRLVTVRVEGDLPPPGTPVFLGEQEAGELRSGRDGLALALLRIDAIEAAGQPGALVAVNAKLSLLRA